MSIQAEGDPALELEKVECSLDQDELLVALSGRWQARSRRRNARAMLIVEVDGRRHRFPAVRRPGRGRTGRLGVWEATFALPAWMQPNLEGHTTVAVGGTAVSVAGFVMIEAESAHEVAPLKEADGDETQFPDGGQGGREMNQEDPLETDGEKHEHEPEPAEAGGDPGVSADTVFGAGADALRAELQERATAEARVRGELADAKAELEARIANQARLSEMHNELRGELERLRDAVVQTEKQQADVESRAMVLAAELAEAQQQLQEAAGGREEASRQRDELAAERDSIAGQRDELLQEREGLNDQVAELRGAVASGIVTADSATAEAAGLREELARLGTELAVVRQQLGIRETGIDEAEALLAEARALTASIREE
jgi:hypothetical protein